MKLSKKLYRIMFVMLCVILISTQFPLPADTLIARASTEKETKKTILVVLNGRTLNFDIQPVVRNQRVLVPMRKIFEELGADVRWDQDTSTAIATLGELNTQVTLNSIYAKANGNEIKLDAAPIARAQRTLVPLRFISESLGAKVDWNGDKMQVDITTDGKVQPFTKNNVGQENITRHNPVGAEEHAMWISFLEFMRMPKNEAGFKREFSRILDKSKDLGMNSVIVHVRSHSDAYYPSTIYPWSKQLTGKQGQAPGYDPLKFMIEETHKRGMKFHAWFNPYRVSGYGTYWNETSEQSPAKKWLNDSNPANDRWVLNQKSLYYLNPSSDAVKNMVIAGVMEVVRNYDIDGVHFDDYFYPSVNDSDPKLCFDKPEYLLYSGNLSIADWRRENVNSLVKGVYTAIKTEKPNVVFGVSPAGNLVNLTSDRAHFVDIKKWLSQPGYVDYIMPQLYWGFEAKSGGRLASYAYEKNLDSWINLVKTPGVKLYVGLDMANAGIDIKDGNAVSEWIRNSDIIARQVRRGRGTGKVSGYAYFRYDSFENSQAKMEVENLRRELGK